MTSSLRYDSYRIQSPNLFTFAFLKKQTMDFLKALSINDTNAGVSTGVNWIKSKGETISSYSPVDGKLIGNVTTADKEAYETVTEKSEGAFKEWRTWPAPKRGESVRQNPWVGWFPTKWEKACRKVMVKYRR